MFCIYIWLLPKICILNIKTIYWWYYGFKVTINLCLSDLLSHGNISIIIGLWFFSRSTNFNGFENKNVHFRFQNRPTTEWFPFYLLWRFTSLISLRPFWIVLSGHFWQWFSVGDWTFRFPFYKKSNWMEIE